MEPATWGFIGTILGTIVGASASIFATYLNGKNSINIQKSTEKFKREELFREFQRDNLLDLQGKLSHSMRLVTKAHLEDLEDYENTREWNLSSLSADLDKEIGDSFRQISIKAERIDNNELRNEIKQLRKKMTECLTANSFGARQGKLLSLMKGFDLLMPKLGEILRENY